MAYREPGVYLELINARPNTGFLPSMIPVIIAEGPAFLDLEGISVTRSAVLTDVLPYTKVTAITRIYTKAADGVETTIAAAANYALTSPNIITWQEAGPAKPATGVVYYVDCEIRPEAIQYEKTFISSFADLTAAYVGDLMKTTSGGAVDTVNPIYTGVFLALESGAPGVYAIQVEPANKTTYAVVIATDIAGSLDRASFIPDAYHLAVMTADSTATGALITHCTSMSGIEEKRERVCYVNLGIANPAAASGIFSSAELDTAIAEAAAISDKRVRAPFITKVTRVFSDGVTRELGCEYFCAALTGLASMLPVKRALTRQKLFNFVEVKHVVQLVRAAKNNLAQAGFMIIEQPGGVGSAAVIRHGTTTKMDNLADREHSVVTIADYTAKYLRSSLEGYIGKENITAMLLTKVTGTITSCFNFLKREEILEKTTIGKILQDEDNPDSLLIDANIKPYYPCNYINIKLLIE